MSVNQVATAMAGSKDNPNKVPVESKQAPKPLGQKIIEQSKDEPLPESHENAALLNLPPLTFSRRPLDGISISPKQEQSPHWSHELYQNLPSCEPVTVTYCRTRQESELAARRLWENERLLGFDMEWKPRYTKEPAKAPSRPPSIREVKENASLIQLACESEVVIFHIAAHIGKTNKELVAPSLRKLLESPAVTKTGVAIMDADSVRLQKYLGIRPRGLFELSHMHNLVKYGANPETQPLVGKRLVALKKQVEEHLGLPLSKGKVRTSNWSKPGGLTPVQLKYAAADAYAGYMLFRVMDEKRKAMIPRSPIPSHVEQKMPIILVVVSIDNAKDDPNQSNRTGGPSGKTPVAEDEADEGDLETADLSNTLKKPRMIYVTPQAQSFLDPKCDSTPAQAQPPSASPLHSTLPSRAAVKQLPQPSAKESLSSGSFRRQSGNATAGSQVYDHGNRTMRQVFSALKGLTAQLAIKFDVKAESIGPENLLQYLSVSRPVSVQDIDEQFMLPSENLIRYCKLASKDLFAFIKQYTPRNAAAVTTVPVVADTAVAYGPGDDGTSAREDQSSETDTALFPDISTSLSREIKRKRTPLVSLTNQAQQSARSTSMSLVSAAAKGSKSGARPNA